MNCSYCFITKIDGAEQLHEEIIETLQSAALCKEIKESYGEDLETIALWGTEPTLTLEYLTPRIPELLKEFPKLSTISFSTNFWTDPQSIRDLITTLRNSLGEGRRFEVKFQISLDGPEEVTDLNRQKGATERITKNFKGFVDWADETEFGNVSVRTSFKPTLSVDNLKNYLTIVDQINFYAFFDELISYWVASERTFGFPRAASITLVVPGEYTSDDGEVFAEFLKVNHRLEGINNRERLFKGLRGSLNSYYPRLKRLLDYGHEIPKKNYMFTCSGGDSCYSKGATNEYHICHRTLYFENPEYKEALAGEFHPFIKDWILKDPPKRELLRWQYVLRNYHDFLKTKLSFIRALTTELVLAGQASTELLASSRLLSLFSLFMVTAHSCPAESILRTGNVHLAPVSVVRITANGAFQELVRRAEEGYYGRC